MNIMEAKRIWAEVRTELRTLLPDHVYFTWVAEMDVSGVEDNKFSLITVHALAPQIIRQNYYKKFIEAFKKVTGKEYDFSIIYDDEFAKKYQKTKVKEKNKPISMLSNEEQENDKLKDNLTQMQSFANLNLKYKFENFVVGDNSAFTHALALNVAKHPAQKYNPLFIYGAPGLGKTHLMQAIGHYIIFNSPKLKVRYIKTEEYVNELIKSIQKGTDRNGKMESFRQKYRNVDILLIDDIQFIEAKTRTIDEIYHTFDSLLNKNKQIVVTSDRIPADIPGLPARLQSRFEKGIVTEITPPDFETRVAILQNLAEQDGISLDFSVSEYIANNFVNNVRELEGAYNKVSAYAAFSNSDITLDLAKKILKCSDNKKEITIELVANKAAEYYGVSLSDFRSPARSQKISNARQIAVYLSRVITDSSFEQIAQFFNKKHPTMVYSFEKIKNDILTDEKLKSDIDYITGKIRG